MAIGIVIALVGMGVALARVRDMSFFAEAAPATVGPENRFCVGIVHPETRLGLVCTRGREQVILEARGRLGVPRDCGDVVLPDSLKSGDLVVLSERDGGCGLETIARLGGALRLLTGTGLHVNKDSADDLLLLPGIGPAKAQRIINNRKKGGPFKTPQELERVRGIGPTTVKRLEPWLEWPDPR
jgi:competence ComEA-like helix-hairpin-helix protein